MTEHTREDAYRLSSPAEHREYYDAWAASYDADFIRARRYLVPTAVARAFLEHATEADTPIADIGCGTGRLGVALGVPGIHGFDVSPAMLDQAAATGAYEALHLSDLTDHGTLIAAEYGGLVSSGTFTHGHLGPADLFSILRLGRPGALCAFGINADHFAAAGFDALLGDLAASRSIDAIAQTQTSSYADDEVPDIPVNRTVVAVLRLRG